MLPQWIIEKKRDGGELTDAEIEFFVAGFTRGTVPDYQAAALAMAVHFRGLTARETAALTRAMRDSGARLDFSDLPFPKVDKHSTGGVGDKLSLVVAPLAACEGVAVPMISGRGLGITGGTMDKLEAIPGYRAALSEAEFASIVRRCGCSIVGQTECLAPADRKLYALRDVTGTVPSIPLIVSSILSKKLAEGLDGLVLDVKCGAGAFMKMLPQARELAASLVAVAREAGCRATALITAMDQPTGRTAGNALEVAEAIEVLRGKGPPDVRDLSLALAVEMLGLAGLASDPEQARRRLTARLASGDALRRFREMVRLHGGDPEAVDDPQRLPAARLQRPVTAEAEGIVQRVDAETVGRVAMLLGAGRTRTTDAVDPAVGVAELVKVGQAVTKGMPLAMLHANDEDRLRQAEQLIAAAFRIGPDPAPPAPLVLERMDG
jgi:pyrimidine-nucleoside phosphorylase